MINWELYIYAVLLHETKHDFGKKDMGRQILDYVKVSEGVDLRFNTQRPNISLAPFTNQFIYIYIFCIIPSPYYQIPVELDTFGTIEWGEFDIGMGLW